MSWNAAVGCLLLLAGWVVQSIKVQINALLRTLLWWIIICMLEISLVCLGLLLPLGDLFICVVSFVIVIPICGWYFMGFVSLVSPLKEYDMSCKKLRVEFTIQALIKTKQSHEKISVLSCLCSLGCGCVRTDIRENGHSFPWHSPRLLVVSATKYFSFSITQCFVAVCTVMCVLAVCATALK